MCVCPLHAARAAVIAIALIALFTIGAGCQRQGNDALSSRAAALKPLALARIAERQQADSITGYASPPATATAPSSTKWLSYVSGGNDADDASDSAGRRQARRDRRGCRGWRVTDWAGSAAHGPRLYSVSSQDESDNIAEIQTMAAGDAGGRAGAPVAEEDLWWQRPLAGRTMRQVIWDDIKLLPRELWKSTKDTATVPGIIILGVAGGVSGIARNNWDDDTDEYFMENRTAWSHDGDFGGFISNPFLHFGVGLAGYAWGIHTENDEMYGFSKTLLQALMLNGMITQGMKWAANDHSPNGETWAWPSGHTSHAVTVAAVVTEYYGPWYGIPAYMLATWGGVSRLNDREHWLSDVIMGYAIGAVVGHSVARGRMVEVGGFTVMPYIPREGGGGIMFVRRF